MIKSRRKLGVKILHFVIGGSFIFIGNNYNWRNSFETGESFLNEIFYFVLNNFFEAIFVFLFTSKNFATIQRRVAIFYVVVDISTVR